MKVFPLLLLTSVVLLSCQDDKASGTPLIEGRTETVKDSLENNEVHLTFKIKSEQIASNPTSSLESAKVFIQNQTQELGAKSPLIEPINCPVRSLRYSDIYNKIEIIKESIGKKCASNSELLNKFLSTVGKLTFANSGNLSTAALNFSTGITDNIDLSTLLTGLSALTTKKECLEELSEKGGALNAISELALQVSQVGLIFPRSVDEEGNPVKTLGSTLSSSGLVFGVLSTLVSQVLTGHKRWNLEKDRNAFINFNCAYFELRKQMQYSGINNNKNDYNFETKTKYLKSLSEAKDILLQVQKEQEKNIGAITKEKNQFIKGKMGENNYSLFNLLNVLQKNAQPSTVQIDKNEKKRRLIEFAQLAPKIEPLLKEYIQHDTTTSRSINYDFWVKIQRLTSYSSQEILLENKTSILNEIESYFASSEEEFNDINSSFYTHSQRIIAELTPSYNLADQEWDLTKKDDLISGVKKLELSGKYEQTIKELQHFIHFYQYHIDILNNLENDEIFVFDDDSVLNSFNIRLVKDEIDNILFGREGERFFRFLKKKIKKELEDFESNFARVLPFLEKDFTKETSNFGKNIICNSVIKVDESFLLAQDAAELAGDFVYTNQQIFNPLENKRRKFLFFKYGRNHKAKVYADALSFLYANKEQNGYSFQGKNFEDAKTLLLQDIESAEELVEDKRNLGFFIKKLLESKDKVRKIKNFIHQNSCYDTLKDQTRHKKSS